jgi:hypothetical protein
MKSMASASTIPPTHVGTHSFRQDEAEDPDPMEFPGLHPKEDEWELVSSSQVKFELAESQVSQNSQNSNPKKMLHSQSSPNLGDYVIDEESLDSENSEYDEAAASKATTTQDDASSSFSLVSGPSSVHSIWSSRISFKDALLKKDESSCTIPEDQEQQQERSNTKKKHAHLRRIRKVKPKFEVVSVTPVQTSIQHAKSTGDLSKLLEADDEIMGDTDAHEYYSRKAQGSLGRKNGRKQRPDEAKRLEITMEKKNLQRAQQGL